MQAKRSLASWLISLCVHGAIVGAIGYGWNTAIESNKKEIAGEISTHISMEMLQGMRVEESQPEPAPEPQPVVEVEKQEIVADPTQKQEIVQKALEKPTPPKPQKAPEKPKEKMKSKEKTAKRQQTKPLKSDLPIGDKNIDSTAKNTSTAQGTGAMISNSASGNGQNSSEIAHYRAALRKEIERNKRYPTRAKMMRKQGIATVSFTVTANGTLSDAKIITSSGDDSLDQAAIQSVNNAKSVGPRPAQMPANLTIPIKFNIKF